MKRPSLANGKRKKIRADYVISYDKNGKAILKFTVKNMSKKKYKEVLWISIYDTRAKETFPDALGKVCSYKRKCTLKPGKSKTFKIDIKKLSKLSKSGWYMDLDRAASVRISL